MHETSYQTTQVPVSSSSSNYSSSPLHLPFTSSPPLQEEKCSTSYEEECSTSYSQECQTSYEQQCQTSYETSYEKACSTSYKKVKALLPDYTILSIK